MALFIKTNNRFGGQQLVNVKAIETMSISTGNGITYTPIRGNEQHSSYSPSIVYCSTKYAEIIFDELTEFIATHTDGVFDAVKRLEELKKS